MSANLGQLDIFNMALGKCGSLPLMSIQDGSAGAIACNTYWRQSVTSVARRHHWQCLLNRANLAQVTLPAGPTFPAQTTIVPPDPFAPPPYTTPTPWAANTAYSANVYVTFGGGLYWVLAAYTSSTNFFNDLNQGYLAEADLFSPSWYSGSGNPPLYEFNNGYQLPPDYIVMVEINGTWCWGRQGGAEYAIYGGTSQGALLLTNAPYANVKYVAYPQDITRLDALFCECLIAVLASNIATVLRKDDANMSSRFLQEFTGVLLPEARVKDAGEKKPRRFNPIGSSNFVRSRYRSTNG